DAAPGNLAFVAQSGAMCTAVIDWAGANNVGFSNIVSLGDMVDVDFGDMLDYLCLDRRTRAVLLYVESITSPRNHTPARWREATPCLKARCGAPASSSWITWRPCLTRRRRLPCPGGSRRATGWR